MTPTRIPHANLLFPINFPTINPPINVDIKYILRLMKEDKRLQISDHERSFLNGLLDKMIAAAENDV